MIIIVILLACLFGIIIGYIARWGQQFHGMAAHEAIKKELDDERRRQAWEKSRLNQESDTNNGQPG